MAYKTHETKNRIIATALELIKTSGYEKVTVNEICRECNISKHTFYYYFLSKDDVLRKFYTIPKELTLERLPEIFLEDNCFERIWMFVEPSIDFFIDNGVEIAKCVFAANITRDVGTFKMENRDHRFQDIIISLYQKAHEAGEIRNNSDSEKLSHYSITCLMSIIFQWASTGGDFDLKKSIRECLEVIADVPAEYRKNFNQTEEEI